MTGGFISADVLLISAVRMIHHSIEPANTPAAKMTACEAVAKDATEAKMPAKNRMVGGLASVRPYAVAKARKPDRAMAWRAPGTGFYSAIRTPSTISNNDPINLIQ